MQGPNLPIDFRARFIADAHFVSDTLAEQSHQHARRVTAAAIAFLDQFSQHLQSLLLL